MTLDKAIEINTDIAADPRYTYDPDKRDAIKLGILALKWIKFERYTKFPHTIPFLNGETL